MGYDYCIQYRSGNTNVVTNTLSKILKNSEPTLLLLLVPYLTFLEELKKYLSQDPVFQQLRHDITNKPAEYTKYAVMKDLSLKGGCIWLPQGFHFIKTLLMEYHSTPTGDHIGDAKTLAHLTENFYWPSLRKDVERFVASFVDCQHTKYETKKVVGLLCPLSIPCRPWEDLSLDFITGLPAYHDYTTILVVVDRFSKGIHLGMLPNHHTSHSMVILFMDIVIKLHGMPRSLVFNCDSLFISRFW